MRMLEFGEQVWREWDSIDDKKKEEYVKVLAQEFNKYEILSICGRAAEKFVEHLPEPERRNKFNPKTLGAMQGMKNLFYNGTHEFNVNKRIILSVVASGTDLDTVARLTTIPIEHLRSATMERD